MCIICTCIRQILTTTTAAAHRKYKFVRDWLPAMTEADSMRLNKILALVAPLLLLILLSIIPPIFGVLTRCEGSLCMPICLSSQASHMYI